MALGATILELNGGSLHIRLDALSQLDDEDWCRISIDVTDSGFSANFNAYLQGRDVEYFAENLSVMYSEVGLLKEAVLQCHEPGVYIKLKSDKNGRIRGEYEFKNENQGEFHPVLSGIFDMDQSYLPDWLSACQTFLAIVRK